MYGYGGSGTNRSYSYSGYTPAYPYSGYSYQAGGGYSLPIGGISPPANAPLAPVASPVVPVNYGKLTLFLLAISTGFSLIALSTMYCCLYFSNPPLVHYALY
jgi:hypothetical protein